MNTPKSRDFDGYSLTSLLLGVMIAGGVLFRIWGLAEPRFFTFDEQEFAKNAHNYLVGLRDANDHPPLGKLVLSVGLLAFGYNSLGWRFAALCFGLQSLVIAYFLGRAMFDSARAGWFAAAFLAADGFFFAYSRVGLLDGTLTCLVLWSLLAAVTARGVAGVALSALLVGLAASVKWSGAFAVFPAAAAVLWLGRAPKTSLVVFLGVPLVHVGIWTLGLYICHQPYNPSALFQVMKGLFEHHLALGKNDNACASPWYTWLWLYHPIVVKLSLHGTTRRIASSAGNPWLWFPATLLALTTPLAAAAALFRPRWRSALLLVASERWRAALVLTLGWLAMFSPWIVARGKYTFFYHYLPSYGFSLVLLAGGVALLERHHARVALWFTAAALAVAAFYLPVWAEFPLGPGAANARLLFRSWRP